MKKILSLTFLILMLYGYTYAQLITHKAPKGVLLNSDFKVLVRMGGGRWSPLPTYLAKVAMMQEGKSIPQHTSFCYFDTSGEVELSVAYNGGSIKDVKIRPLSLSIKPKIKGNKISFILKRNQYISVEVNGDIYHNLQVFSNSIESFKPSVSDTNVLYYGPGVHRAGNVNLSSGKTVFIDGGAVVIGSFRISHQQNIRILGHGILTQLSELISGDTEVLKSDDVVTSTAAVNGSRNDMLTVEYSENVEINGPIVLPHKYSVLVGQSKNVSIRNLKSFSYEGWGDGLDVFCSTDILIDHVFMRNSDDCIAIYGHRWNYYGDVKNVTVKNSSLWPDIAHPILIGTHGDSANPNVLSDMKFLNIDILNQRENQIDYQGCLALNAGDSNRIRDIRFEDIRIEDVLKGQLVNLRVMFNHKYNTSAGKGIENIYFKNVSYNGRKPNLSVIAGYDESHAIKNVVFENLRINGELVTDHMPGKPAWYKTGDMANFYIGEHAETIKFIPSAN